VLTVINFINANEPDGEAEPEPYLADNKAEDATLLSLLASDVASRSADTKAIAVGSAVVAVLTNAPSWPLAGAALNVNCPAVFCVCF